MFSLIFVYLCCQYVANANNSNGKRILQLGRPFGVLGCRKQCEDRKECVNVNYSPLTMSCVLKLSIIASPREEKVCRTGFCVQRALQTRAGTSVTVLEIYADHPKKETGFHFIPLNKDPCRVSGKGNNILKPKRTYSWRQGCKARVDQTFLWNGKYSWTVTVKQTDKTKSIVHFLFESVHTRKTVLEFGLFKLNKKYEIRKSDLRRVYFKSPATLKFTLSTGILHVMDLNTKVRRMTNTLGTRPEDRFNLLICMKVKGVSNLKITLHTNRPSDFDNK